jgi:hypothetical protein
MKLKAIKKVLIIGWVVALSVPGYVWFATDYPDKTVIVMNDGRLIAADATWDSGNELMYENDDEMHFVDQQDVERIEKRQLRHLFLDMKNRVGAIFRAAAAPLIRWVSDRSADPPSLLGHPMVAFALIACLGTLLTLRLMRGRSTENPIAPKAPPPPSKEPLWPPDKLDVVRFFLNVYRIQLGAPADARVESSQLISEGSSSNEIFELRVNHQGDWVSRRMTIGPLGEESGSKSKCYYVIYDVHLVVKVPAQPLDDFDEYIASMEKEGKIVDKLAPKECIIPKVSVILSLIHSLPFIGDVSAELIEDTYVDWLRKKPEYIENLKINGGFVYFMDLSRYYFLGHILSGIHDLNEAVPAEIIDHPELIWEAAKFKGRYGEENETVCFEIRDVYNKCASAIHSLMNEQAPDTRLSPFDIQSWFLMHLAHKPVTAKDSKLPAGVLAPVNRCLGKILADNAAAVDSYRGTIRNYVGRLRAEQDKLIMGSISTNLLDLLAWLGHKKIAMRDLKPDNLLVAGDPRKYPHFLRTASEYSLGIIDVETAVDYDVSRGRKIRQPLLGGTPFFATPSHFIRNTALSKTYGELGNILHLQDWYAVMVMIYRVITGGLLFEQTAKQFADIKNKIVISNRRTGSELAAIETVSRQFWRSAGLEFQKKIRAQEKTLKTVPVAISPYAGRLLISYLRKDILTIDRSVRKIVASHPLLSSAANREVLLNADHGKICALAADIAGKSGTASSAGDHQAQMMAVINKLANQKLLLARKRQLLARLAMDTPSMSAYELMIVMFNTVLKAMYKEQWQSFKPAPAEPVCKTEDEVSLATTI